MLFCKAGVGGGGGGGRLQYCVMGEGCRQPEGVFLDVIGTKILVLFAPCYSQSPSPADFTPLYSFLGLEIQKQQLKEGGALLCLHFTNIN